MKKCSYCGKEYPDNATVCAIDGEVLESKVLESSGGERKGVTGVWRGVYGYSESKRLAGMGAVAFTLKLKQGWTAHFTGSVTEDHPRGMPGMGAVDGYFKSPTIEFTKQMPVGYITGRNGILKTLREFIISEGHQCECDLPSPPIFYQGTFLDANRVQGMWSINPHKIPLPDGFSFSTPRTSGYWCAEFVTSDAKVDPTGGPSEALFDKSLLSPVVIDDVEGGALRSLGKFNVPDSEKLLERLTRENIRSEISRDDAPIREMSPMTSMMGGYAGTARIIEIFIHPEDMAKAEAILHQDHKA
jgi:hypothetical protein